MFLMFFVLAWVGFVRVVVKTEWWRLCAALYACSILFLTLACGVPLSFCALVTMWMGGIAGVHFWVLVRFLDTGALWYLALVLGFVVVHAPIWLF